MPLALDSFRNFAAGPIEVESYKAVLLLGAAFGAPASVGRHACERVATADQRVPSAR
jgi:hypothetical protein